MTTVTTRPVRERGRGTGARGGRRGASRRARLTVSRVDPWSVTRTAFVLSLGVAIVLQVATALLWWFLSATGVFSAIGGTVGDLLGGSTSTVSIDALLSFSRVMGFVLVLSAIEIVMVTVLATLFAVLYNLTVDLSGGLEVTLAEERPAGGATPGTRTDGDGTAPDFRASDPLR